MPSSDDEKEFAESLAKVIACDIMVTFNGKSTMHRKSNRVSANEYKVYRHAIMEKLTKAQFPEEMRNQFYTILDRVGKNGIVEFLFMIEKVGGILPLTDVELLEARQQVKSERQERTCPKCGRLKYRADSDCYGCPRR